MRSIAGARPNSADNMVCCDRCEAWEHFQCAGVNASIADSHRSWICRRCEPAPEADAEAAEEEANDERSEPTVSIAETEGSHRSRTLQLRLTLLEEEKKLQMQYLKEKYDLLEQLQREEAESSKRSNVSVRKKTKRTEEWLMKSVKVTEGCRGAVPSQQQAVTQLPVSQQLSPAGEVSSVPHAETDTNPKVTEGVLALQSVKASTPKARALVATSAPIPVVAGDAFVISPTVQGPTVVNLVPSSTELCGVTAALSTSLAVSGERSKPPEITRRKLAEPVRTVYGMPCGYSGNHTQVQDSHAPIQSSQPGVSPSHNTRFCGITEVANQRTVYPAVTQQRAMPACDSGALHGSGCQQYNEAVVGPTPSQLAARHVMPKDLPKFSGDPNEWPIFYSSFCNTTEVCGYSQAENLARLQRCLSGQALETVRSRLLLPAAVPRVMETLYTLYGRPEILMNGLLRKMRAVPPPKAESLQSILAFGLAVQNLVDHVVLSNQEAHLTNPMLLQELVGKLPASLKLQWGSYKRNIAEVNLSTFQEFMGDLVSIAADLTVSTEPPPKSSNLGRGRQKESIFVHAQEKNGETRREDVTASAESPPKRCSYCGDTRHRIADCSKFTVLTLDERWKAVRQKNLCRTCLVLHRRWPCRSKKECGVEACRLRHHTFLHGGQRSQQGHSSSSTSHAINHNHHLASSHSLFRYLPVTLYGEGTQIDTYAFLDEGSSTTLLEASVASKLGVKGTPDTLRLIWTGGIGRHEEASERVQIKASGVGKNNVLKMQNVRTVERLDLPTQSLDYPQLAESFPHLRGLPVSSYEHATPRILIGLEHAHLLTALKVREGHENEPIATKTRLGWCVFGRSSRCEGSVDRLNVHVDPMSNEGLHEAMRSFFAVEEAAVAKRLMAETDKQA